MLSGNIQKINQLPFRAREKQAVGEMNVRTPHAPHLIRTMTVINQHPCHSDISAPTSPTKPPWFTAECVAKNWTSDDRNDY